MNGLRKSKELTAHSSHQSLMHWRNQQVLTLLLFVESWQTVQGDVNIMSTALRPLTSSKLIESVQR